MPDNAGILSQAESASNSQIIPIVVDHKAGAIRVGKWSQTLPCALVRRPENDTNLKAQILRENNRPSFYDGSSMKATHEHFAKHLGTRFNHRMNGARWELWASWLTPRLLNAFQQPRYRGTFNQFLLVGANVSRQHVEQCVSDGLDHLAPVVAAFRMSPSEIRAVMGRAMWRRVANSSLTRNAATAKMADKMEMGDSVSELVRAFDLGLALRISDIRAAPSVLIADTASELPDEMKHARRISAPTEFRHSLDLIRDAKNMGAYNPAWGFARLQREHDEASYRAACGDYSDEPFCPEHVCTVDGYTFTRLISQAAVAAEGSKMHHCVASYAGKCQTGNYAVYTVEGRGERATLGLHMINGAPSFNQLYGHCNSRVSDFCRSAALDFINDPEFSKEWGIAA